MVCDFFGGSRRVVVINGGQGEVERRVGENRFFFTLLCRVNSMCAVSWSVLFTFHVR